MENFTLILKNDVVQREGIVIIYLKRRRVGLDEEGLG